MQEHRTEISEKLANAGIWCGEASLLAFGINKVTGRWQDTCWARVVCALRDLVGHDLEYAQKPWDKPITLKAFIAAHPEGDYIIQTADHTMALRDGRLTDTDLSGTGLRRVTAAYRVQ